MKKNLTFCCVGALCLLASCSDDVKFTPQQSGDMLITGSTGTFSPLSGTRTQVGDMADDGSLLIEWSAGDRIGVFGGSLTTNALFTGNNTEPAAQASFSGTLVGGEIPAYAYYPYSEGTTDMHSVPVSIPETQTYADESSVAQYDVKASSEMFADPQGGYRARFRQMAALVRFTFDLTGVSYLDPDERLEEVTIHQTRTGVPMAGEFSYDLANLDAGLVAGNATTDGITLVMENRPTVDNVITAYAVVAPGAQQGNEWCCVFSTDKHSVTFYTEALCDFEAGMYYTVPVNVTVLENNEATYEEIPQVPEEETANCYMITTAGEHSFLATVIGNGEKGIIPGAGFHTENPYIDPQSAKLLWEDTPGFVTSVELRDDGRVYYTTDGNVGNAVIAVYSQPGQQGEILWSWHIWGVGDELPQDEVITNRVGSKFTMMDRTLGAHSKTSVTATLYQWGRKDPFPNASTYYVDDEEIEILSEFPVYESNGTILESVQHPDCFILYGTGNEDWLSSNHDLLWGNEYKTGGFGTETAVQGWSNVKTIYDPSPVGYRVSGQFAWTGFVKTTMNLYANNLDRINQVKYDDGYYFKKDENDTEGTFYPMVGSRGFYGGVRGGIVDNDRYLVGYNAVYWSSTPAREVSGIGRAYMMEIGAYTAPSLNEDNPDEKVWVNYVAGRDGAFGIRCERE